MPAIDDSRGKGTGLSDTLSHLANVTPDNGNDLTYASRAIYVEVAGTLAITTLGGETVTTPSLNQGWHPIRATRIFATGTTATGIMVGW